MKTFNLKLLTSSLLTTLLLTGCMPDSLTKFKKEPPKKVTDTGVVAPPVTDESGNLIDPATLVDPTIFKIRVADDTETITTKSYQVGDTVNLTALLDGSIGRDSYRSSLMIKCEITTATALPPGFSLDAENCAIEGRALAVTSDTDPLNFGKPIPYTIRLHYIGKSGTIKTMDTSISLGVFQKIDAFAYSQNEKLLMRLSPTSGALVTSIVPNIKEDDPYVREGLLSSPDGTVGVIKFVDAVTSRVGIVRVIPIEVEDITALSYFDTSQATPTEQYPSLVTARFISNNADTVGSNDAVAKVVKLYRPNTTSTRGIVYVEMLSKDIYFQEGQAIDDAKTYVGQATRITTKNTAAGTLGIDTDFILRRSGSSFAVDNDYQFFEDKFIVSALVRVYEPGVQIASGIKLLPITNTALVPANNVTFTVSPALPSGLSLNSTTGEISGAFAGTLDGASFTVTAKNDLGSASAVVGLGAIYAPKDLSYTDRQIISVNSNAKFREGEMLFRPITPPMETNIKARILRKIGTTKLTIENINGSFTAGASLDSGNTFYSEKTFIPTTAVTPTATTAASTPIVAHYNIAMTLADATNFAVEGYVSNAAGARGRIAAKEGNIIFVQYLTPGDPAVATAFSQANAVDNAETFVAGETTISQIESTNLKITLGGATVGAPTFDKGEDITSDGKLGAYVFAVDSTVPAAPVLSISDITKKPDSTPYFLNGQIVYDDEIVTASSKAISDVSYINTFFVENGVSLELKSNLYRGNNIVFTITPALPTGMTLDTRTGVISGRPTVRVASKEYVISAVNLMGKTDYVFQLEVRDYFKVADTSNAPSFILHKYGDNQQYRSCRINAADIIEGEGSRDIRCFLEAEEQDLHNLDIKFATSAGAGVCEFISVFPFSFYKMPPHQTPATTTKNVLAGCAVAGLGGVPADATNVTPTANNTCVGNYTDIEGPNCDEGKFNYIIWTGTDGNADGDCSDAGESVAGAPITVNCGGNPNACLEGPARDLLEDAAINEGNRGIVFSAVDGSSSSQTYNAPLEKGYVTNMRNANSTTRNACTNSRTDAKAWNDMVKLADPTLQPFGVSTSPFYTYNCLDSARDIKARIRIVVRDWDRTFKIDNLIDLDIPYDVALPAKNHIMDAGYAEDSFSELYNNYEDWDDSYLASYCSNSAFTSEAACTGGGGTWYKSRPECSIITHKNKTDCLANGGTWDRDTGAQYGACGTLPATNDRHKFPGLDL